MWSHGLISDSSYQMLNTACNYSQILRQMVISKTITHVCAAVHKQVFDEVSDQVILGDISRDPCLSTSTSSHASQLVCISTYSFLSFILSWFYTTPSGP